MRYRIRKGLESPCMIRGLLSGDYWIFVGCCSAAFVLFFLGIRAGISAGNWNLPVLVLVISLPTLPLLLYKLKRKARPQKFKETGKEINISNLDINRVLTKKEHNEIRRGIQRKYSINSLVYWVTYVHNVVYSFYRSMIYCYINSTQRCAGSIVIDIIPTNGADKRKFFPFAPYFPVTNVIKRYFYPYFPAIIGIKGYSFPYFPYLSGIMKIKTALYSLFSRLDWHKTVVFPCLGEIYEGIRSLSWEIPVT